MDNFCEYRLLDILTFWPFFLMIIDIEKYTLYPNDELWLILKFKNMKFKKLKFV